MASDLESDAYLFLLLVSSNLLVLTKLTEIIP